MAFLMAAAAACEVFESQSAAQSDADVAPAEAGGGTGGHVSGSLNLARSYMQQARSAAAGLLAQQALQGGDAAAAAGAAGDPKSDVYLLLLVSAAGSLQECWGGGGWLWQQECGPACLPVTMAACIAVLPPCRRTSSCAPWRRMCPPSWQPWSVPGWEGLLGWIAAGGAAAGFTDATC
jgi:hypothetical protein